MLAPLLTMAMMAASPPSPCSFRTPAGCVHADWRYGFGAPFKRALARFAGRTRCTAYTRRSRSLPAVFRDATSGAPGDPVRLADGTLIFSASRWHDGLDKGYVILSAAGHIVALALNHPSPSGDVLEIYVRQRVLGHPAWLDPLLAKARDNAELLARYPPKRTASVAVWQVSDRSTKPLSLARFPLAGPDPS